MRLIDADKLIERLKHSFYPEERVSIETITECFLDKMGCAPTIDAEPVKHGTWIYCEYSGGRYIGTCSLCGCERKMDKYCPNCGAKMDGKREKE